MTTGFTQDPLPMADMDAPRSVPMRSGDMKSPAAFRTISEVASDLAVPQHVLRFWESKFQQIRPLKRGGGRRYYRPEDINLISSIKDLLYNQGFTIRGVQNLHRENGRTSARSMVAEPQVPASLSSAPQQQQQTVAANATMQQHQQQRTQQAPGYGLSPEKKRELEAVLSELKSLRALLKQSGI